MTRKQLKIIIGINLLTILVVLSPFLPGPSFMSGLTNMIFSLIQIGSIIGLLLIPVGLIRTINQARNKDKENNKVTPILLLTVPILAFIISLWGAGFARDFSRNMAINNAEKLITAIENYKDINGQYPNDIIQLKPDFIERVPKPWIMGISGYNYENINDNYNLTFTQNVIINFNFEVVVYDPLGNHKAEGELKTLYTTGKDKWKYYIYD